MYAAWLGALLVGLVLGLLGSGGSILTVPVLVYLVGEPSKLAIAESLGIVALISLVGAVPFAVQGQVSWRSVGWFGGPGIVGAYLARTGRTVKYVNDAFANYDVAKSEAVAA